MRKPTILIMTGDTTLYQKVQELVRPQGEVVRATSPTTISLQTLRHASPDLVIIGPNQENPAYSVETAARLHRWDKTVPVILLMPHSSEELVLTALRAGVRDYFKLPFAFADLAVSIGSCLAEVRVQESQVTPCPSLDGDADRQLMIGDSLPTRQIKDFLGKVALTDSTVLITGETGTGKELAAALIHQHSRRSRRPLISINCAAIPDDLLESELFGYERGAFTGAHATKAGMLQLAEGGTVFLDEIGDMSLYAQAKILRAIDSKMVQHLGGKRSIPLNIRIIAATNRPLEQLVDTETFRKDLYFRLNVARVHLPPLRERREDVPLLLAHYIQEANGRFGRQVESFTDEALACLLRYAWPGNVRELKNLVEASFVNLPSLHITYMDLPDMFRRQCEATADLPQDERDRVLYALLATKWNKSKAAEKLHWSRMTLYRKMAKYHIAYNDNKLERERAAHGRNTVIAMTTVTAL